MNVFIESYCNVNFLVERMYCAAHNLQLAIQESLKFDAVEELVQRLSKLVASCKKSTIVADKLRESNKFLRTRNKMEQCVHDVKKCT
jgi:hypothetical protein